MTILHLDASINGENSASRALSNSIVEQIKAGQWGEEVVYRDLAANPLATPDARSLRRHDGRSTSSLPPTRW